MRQPKKRDQKMGNFGEEILSETAVFLI